MFLLWSEMWGAARAGLQMRFWVSVVSVRVASLQVDPPNCPRVAGQLGLQIPCTFLSFPDC